MDDRPTARRYGFSNQTEGGLRLRYFDAFDRATDLDWLTADADTLPYDRMKLKDQKFPARKRRNKDLVVLKALLLSQTPLPAIICYGIGNRFLVQQRACMASDHCQSKVGCQFRPSFARLLPHNQHLAVRAVSTVDRRSEFSEHSLIRRSDSLKSERRKWSRLEFHLSPCLPR